jgi:MFS family permease
MTVVVSVALLGALLIFGGAFFSFAAFLPVAVAGGALLGPIMVAIDTLLHESAQPTARAVVFSTRDLVLGAAFMVWSGLVGGGVWLAGRLGSVEPYRLALVMLGVLICAAGVAGSAQVIRHGTKPRLEREKAAR